MSGSGSGQRTHILDKMDTLNELGMEFDRNLEADVDKLANRYMEVKAKQEKVFDRQHSALEARDTKLDQIDARLDRLSNLGNSSGNSKTLSNGGETNKPVTPETD